MGSRVGKETGGESGQSISYTCMELWKSKKPQELLTKVRKPLRPFAE